MVYSCAYFETPQDDLDTAQLRKLDYICRKLRLRPGERLLDIGCGWGGLIIHAAQTYGVTALGITLSRPQTDLAAQRIQQAGVAGRCRVEVCDYRDIDGAGRYDKLVSVGMVEHVGKAKLPEYFSQAWRLLRPGGVFLNHGIVYRPAYVAKSWTVWPRQHGFGTRYVFPDGEFVPLDVMLRVAEESGLEIRDVESLREHYTLTLRHWVRRLEAQHEAARRSVGEVTYRIWRLYMAGASYLFQKDHLSVYQTLRSKPDRGVSGLPLTRADWYN